MWSLVNEVLLVAAGTLSVLILIPRLGSSAYGAFAGAYALIGPFAAFAHSGVTLTILEHTVRDDEGASDVVRSCMSIALLMAAVMAPVVVFLGSLFIRSFAISTMIMFVFSELMVQAVLLTIATTLQGAHRYSTGIIVRASSQVLRMVVLVVLAITHNVSLTSITVATGTALTALTACVLVIAQRLGMGDLRPGRIDGRHFKNVFLYGSGLSASIAQNDGDKVALNASGFQQDAGIYSAAYRLLSMGMLPLAAFTNSTHFAVLRSARETSDQVAKARRFTMIGAIYAVPVAAGFFIAAPLAPKLLGSQFEGTATVLRWLAPLFALRGMMVFPLNGLLGLGRGRLRAGVLIGSAALSVVLYIVLIPRYSWKGAAVASMISDATLFCACWTSLILCQRNQHGMPHHDALVAGTDSASFEVTDDAVLRASELQGPV